MCACGNPHNLDDYMTTSPQLPSAQMRAFQHTDSANSHPLLALDARAPPQREHPEALGERLCSEMRSERWGNEQAMQTL